MPFSSATARTAALRADGDVVVHRDRCDVRDRHRGVELVALTLDRLTWRMSPSGFIPARLSTGLLERASVNVAAWRY